MTSKLRSLHLSDYINDVKPLPGDFQSANFYLNWKRVHYLAEVQDGEKDLTRFSKKPSDVNQKEILNLETVVLVVSPKNILPLSRVTKVL